MKCHSLFVCLLLAALHCSCKATSQTVPAPVQAPEFSKNWYFSKGDPEGARDRDFADGDWETVSIPHDWAIEGPFDSKYNARTGGLPVHGTAWYRKHFTPGKDWAGKRVAVLFDGVMNNGTVYLNGQQIGERPFGYIGFEVDMTPHLKIGQDNVLAVRVAPEDLSSRWYSGAGIYRDVHLKVDAPLHIPLWGTYITTPEVTKERATVKVATTLANTGGSTGSATLETVIIDANGTTVASDRRAVSVSAGQELTEEVSVTIDRPRRWHTDDPHLYSVRTRLLMGESILDEYDSSFGARTISFSQKEGFVLNGEAMEFYGVCMHHDLGPLGAAVNYRATERQMEIMKEMGVNALRTSHNPPSEETLEICDRLGIVVLDEAFDEWKIGKVENGYNKVFDEWHERDLRDMIRRDRNHPSVIMWSIGNEILEQADKNGWKVAKMLNDICHDEDPTRPTTAGFNNYGGAFNNKLADQVDIVGLNYKPYYYGHAIGSNRDMIIYGSETSSQTSSRGVYHLPLQAEHDRATGHVSSYDVAVGPPWAYPPEVEFDAQDAHPSLLGEFIWTGFDYLGEPTPYGGRDNSTNGYWNDDWPSHSSYFGPVDLCGFPKDRFYLYQSRWTETPMVHLLPHWNWPERKGQSIPVFAYTNAEEAELFLNGKSLGRKVKGVDLTYISAEFRGFPRGDYPSKHRLSWEVPYEAGTLRVVAYEDGAVVAEDEVRTAGAPAAIRLEADRTNLEASGEDLSFITVTVVDTAGIPCPRADNTVTFSVTGTGNLEAVGNGDQTSLESFQANYIKAFSGMCLAIVRGNEEAGQITLTAKSEGLKAAKIALQTTQEDE